MAKFIAISGPSSTGKTSLIDSLSMYHELSNVIITPDIFNAVWSDLVEQGYFEEWKQINTDSSYLCVYIMRLIAYYEELLEKYEDTDKIVILDGCWVDLAVYATLNLWYNRVIKEVQEDILSKVLRFNDKISKIYFTRFSNAKHEVRKYQSEYKIANMKLSRPLEIQYYHMFENFKNATVLPTTDNTEASLFIINDLKELGYL